MHPAECGGDGRRRVGRLLDAEQAGGGAERQRRAAFAGASVRTRFSSTSAQTSTIEIGRRAVPEDHSDAEPEQGRQRW